MQRARPLDIQSSEEEESDKEEKNQKYILPTFSLYEEKKERTRVY